MEFRGNVTGSRESVGEGVSQDGETSNVKSVRFFSVLFCEFVHEISNLDKSQNSSHK